MDSVFATTRRAGILVVLPVLLVLLLAINAPPFVPLQDYNEWVYQGFVAAQLLHGHLTDHFAFAAFPVPNSAAQALLCLLTLVIPPMWAARVVASVYVVAAVALGWMLSKKMSRTQNISYFFLLLVCVYFNTPFWDGYINYQLGLLLFSIWLLMDPATRRKPLWALAFSIAGFFTHAVIWASILLLMAVDAVRRRKYLCYLPALVSLALFAWYVVCKPAPKAPNAISSSGLLHAIAYKLYTLAKLGPYHNFVYSGGAGSQLESAGFYVGCAVNFVFAAGLVYMLCVALLRQLRNGGGWKRVSDETLALLVLLALFIVMPAVMADVVNPGERMLYPALLLALLGPGDARVVRWLSASVVALAACALGLVASGARLVPDSALADARAGASKPALFQSRPAEFYNVWPVLDGAAPVLALGFETSFLFNRSSPHGRGVH
jgi:hypothetical protein